MHFRRLPKHFLIPDSLTIPVVIFFLALVYLWPLVLHPDQIPMTGVQQVTDFVVAHLSYAQYIHHMWFTYGHPPLWNSSMLSGMPLIADPLSGYFYLPNWLTFIFPAPASYNLLFALHLAWTGLGLFYFLRSNSIHPLPALFGAAAWMGTTKLIGYVGDGQVSSVFALAWFPWLLLVNDRLTKSLSLRNASLSAGVLAIITLVDIRWGFFAGMLSMAFLISQFLYRKIPLWQIGKILAIYLAATALLTAVLTIPLYELMLRSDRVSLSAVDRAIFSLDVPQLLGMFAPQFGILYELATYVGMEVLVLALFGLDRKRWFWIALIGFAIFLSLGPNGPLFLLFSNFVPGFTWLRVPSRFWFFAALGFAILSAYGLDKIIYVSDRQKIVRWFRPISLAISLFAILLAVGFALFFPPLPNGILAFAIFLPAVLVLLNFILQSTHKVWGIALVFLMVSDLVWVNASIFRSVPLEPASAAERWLETQPGLFRVYSPSYSLPLPHQLQTAEGINPTHLQNYGEFMATASGIRIKDYSVSVPGIYLDEFSDPQLYATAAFPDMERLGILNVKYIVTSFPLKIAAQTIKTFDNVYISTNPEYRERAWIDGDTKGIVRITDWSPDRIVAQVSSNGDALVVFSEIDYPGWKATVDNLHTSIERVDNLLRGVRVLTGNHELVLNFVPQSFYAGLIVSIMGWLFFFFILRSYVAAFLARFRSDLS